ncbi:MAG: hypothetical protein V8T87_15655 [Victivallales bacterium]
MVKSDTPLQQKMAKLGKRITLLGFLAAALVFFDSGSDICGERDRFPGYGF